MLFVKEQNSKREHSEKSHAKKRPSTENGHGSTDRKKARVSDVGVQRSIEEEEHVKSVEEKLKLMKQSPKKHSTSRTPTSNKHEPEPSGSPQKGSHTLGPPREKAKWEQHDKLYVYTAKGVRASSKVRCAQTCSNIGLVRNLWVRN